MPNTFAKLASELAELSTRENIEIHELLTNPTTLMLIIAAVIGLVIWGFIHSNFIRPFVLVGVLRNFMESGMKDIPSESSFAELEQKSAKFATLRKSLKE
jgi:hypothetical protein